MVYPIYNKALNLKLNNLKFTFVFFYFWISTLAIFVPIATIHLISVDDSIYINITRIMLLVEESGNIKANLE